MSLLGSRAASSVGMPMLAMSALSKRILLTCHLRPERCCSRMLGHVRLELSPHRTNSTFLARISVSCSCAACACLPLGPTRLLCRGQLDEYGDRSVFHFRRVCFPCVAPDVRHRPRLSGGGSTSDATSRCQPWTSMCRSATHPASRSCAMASPWHGAQLAVDAGPPPALHDLLADAHWPEAPATSDMPLRA